MLRNESNDIYRHTDKIEAQLAVRCTLLYNCSFVRVNFSSQQKNKIYRYTSVDKTENKH